MGLCGAENWEGANGAMKREINVSVCICCAKIETSSHLQREMECGVHNCKKWACSFVGLVKQSEKSSRIAKEYGRSLVMTRLN